MANTGSNMNPIGMSKAVAGFSPLFERAIKDSLSTTETIRTLCTAQFKTKKYYDLGNSLFTIASPDGGFLNCVAKAATDCKGTVEAILTMKAYKDDEAVKSEAKKAIESMERVISMAKGSGAKIPQMKSETVEGSKIVEPYKSQFIESVKKMSRVRENFIRDLAESTHKIEDEGLNKILRKNCQATEKDCNVLCQALKKHNELMSELGIDITSILTNAANAGAGKSAVDPSRLKGAKL